MLRSERPLFCHLAPKHWPPCPHTAIERATRHPSTNATSLLSFCHPVQHKSDVATLSQRSICLHFQRLCFAARSSGSWTTMVRTRASRAAASVDVTAQRASSTYSECSDGVNHVERSSIPSLVLIQASVALFLLHAFPGLPRSLPVVHLCYRIVQQGCQRLEGHKQRRCAR